MGKTDKGRDINRTLVLGILVWVATELKDYKGLPAEVAAIKQDVAAIKRKVMPDTYNTDNLPTGTNTVLASKP